MLILWTIAIYKYCWKHNYLLADNTPLVAVNNDAKNNYNKLVQNTLSPIENF